LVRSTVVAVLSAIESACVDHGFLEVILKLWIPVLPVMEKAVVPPATGEVVYWV